MTRIYLIRHGEAEGNLYRRFHGWYNSSLTDTGRKQLGYLAQRFEDIPLDAVYASDLRRAYDTAQAVAAPKGLTVETDPALRELGVGVYENLPFGELCYRHPEVKRRFLSCSPHFAPQGGETFHQVAQRMTKALFRIAQAHPDQTVAIGSHSTAIRCLQAALRGKHPSQVAQELTLCENTGVSCYEVQGEKFRTLFENDASHLPPALATMARRQRAYGPVPAVWYESMDLDGEAEAYYAARQDAWIAAHGSLLGFDGPGFLRDAREQWEWDPRAVQRAYDGDRPVGILQLAILEGVREGVGHVPFLYVEPDMRRKTIGIQLLGQAIYTYRSLGRRVLRLQCAPENRPAMTFYLRYGFHKVGQVPGAVSTLDLLEKEL